MSIFSSLRHHDEISKDKQIQDIKLTKIKPNSYQPRREFSDESIRELAATLDKDGLLQPIIVREKGEDYEIIAGERRFRAAQHLAWERIPAIVNNMDDSQAASLALIENLQREDLNPIDEAQAYSNLMQLNHLTQTTLAQNIGKSQSYVANKLRLLKLTPKVQSYLASGEISPRHGRSLVGLSEKDQGRVLDEVLANNLNVSETEKIARDVEGYFADKKAKIKEQAKTEQTQRAVNRIPKDMKVQINTIKRAVKLAKESGIKVKVKENNDPDDYMITIEMKRK
ncbi:MULTISPECIES: nucleoid occlusion protein [unclassified Lactobacillus]|uniref:nucleoid occlusion protein n=1 Tax=unclassified Lactobacillus TaxID=2620435 RepID=UPI000EFCF587|nr:MULTISPECIES: nucleoid occlusion protein [unclassified Lactobacillus]RMC25767.1 nucleoid occlusion protein [Lactobacillus sp. ESL0247]RMC29579.1 nucleoid occlusion protein [Lactobacillus sp. ESL0246]RMC33568.1 nucleoid occlusion protein [Lactobacillus sp. ESL0245]